MATGPFHPGYARCFPSGTPTTMTRRVADIRVLLMREPPVTFGHGFAVFGTEAALGGYITVSSLSIEENTRILLLCRLIRYALMHVYRLFILRIV